MAFESDQLYGSFVPTTRKFSEQKVKEISISSPQFKEFLVDLLQAINDMSVVLNTKESGYYVLQEFLNGNLFFPDPTISRTASNVQNPDYRQEWRDVVNLGQLNGIGVPSSAAHHITFDSSITGTIVTGCATNPGSSIRPIPNEDIEITTTQVVVTPSIDLSSYSKSIVIISYLRN